MIATPSPLTAAELAEVRRDIHEAQRALATLIVLVSALVNPYASSGAVIAQLLEPRSLSPEDRERRFERLFSEYFPRLPTASDLAIMPRPALRNPGGGWPVHQPN